MNTSTDFHETKSLFAADKRLLFVLLCLATLALLFVKIAFIENETAAFEFLQDRPEGMVLRIINTLKYLSIPFVYLWKFTVIAFVIWVGCFMFGYRVTYRQCWGVVIGSEFVFLVPELLKIMWFMTVETDPSYHDIRAFYPLSLMHFVDYYSLDKRWAYPLRALNLFEIAYWFVLVSGIHHYARKEKRVVWIIVACSYILIFFLWLLFYVIVYK
ncbi:MAG: sulfate ABC transporter permease [Bacteroidota bacterium]